MCLFDGGGGASPRPRPFDTIRAAPRPRRPMARLFIPGPTDVVPETLAAQTRPMVGHRSQACADLFARAQPALRHVLGTTDRVFTLASSGSGLQAGAVR